MFGHKSENLRYEAGMIVLRFIVNVAILAFEIALVAAAAWLGLHHPLTFAALTAGLTLAFGLVLEHARLRHELPFYFGKGFSGHALFARLMAFIDAIVKALLAGLMALITFSGTDPERLFWVAIFFGVSIFAGSSLLRRLSISLNAQPSRWGYFRLAAPLGLLFSFALSFLPTKSFADIGMTIVFDLPAKPSISQASEVLFVLKQKFDAMIVLALSGFMSPEAAQLAGTLVSVNVLSGFVIAIYAVLIAEAVRWLEEASP
ncbi:hypothetical protein [Filomicrobium insigne]|nr:hypothetical protein [Filomicrobium insigne]